MIVYQHIELLSFILLSLLFLSIALLFVAPLLNLIPTQKQFIFSSLNGFVFVVIVALVTLDILPELVEIAGPGVMAAMLFGLALPALSEKAFHNRAVVHKLAAMAGVCGLLIHALIDGAALSMEDSHHNLALSVALHRIPIGLFVWWFVRPHFGTIVSVSMLALIAAGTLLGFFYTEALVSPLQTSLIAYFQAFVVGTLIHVIFHKPSFGDIDKLQHHTNNKAEGVGNLLGLISVFYLLQHSHHHEGELHWVGEVLDTLVYLSLETAPMLLLAFLFAGIIKSFLPDTFTSWLKKGRSLPQATKGMVVGIPLPLCSCSVVPVYHTLIKKGVPPSAAIAFLIATPELGIDALLISLPLLGADLTVMRLICAAILAVIVALVVSRYIPKLETEEEHTQDTHKHDSFQTKLKSGMHYATHDLLDHIAPWILAGIIIAAAIHPILNDLQLGSISPTWQVIIFAGLGIPVYVCASSATPLVAIFLVGGVSPGAGLAFLLAGPATNISTFGVLAQLHNKFSAALLAISCFTTAIALGIATNALLPNFQPINIDNHTHDFGMLHWSALAMLSVLFSYSVYRNGMRSFLMQLIPHQHDKGGNCGHDHGDGSHCHHPHSNADHDSHQHSHHSHGHSHHNH